MRVENSKGRGEIAGCQNFLLLQQHFTNLQNLSPIPYHLNATKTENNVEKGENAGYQIFLLFQKHFTNLQNLNP